MVTLRPFSACGLVHASRAGERSRRNSPRLCAAAAAFLLLDRRLDLRLHFVERLNASILLVFDQNDVESVAGADDTGHLSLGRVESRLLEFGNGASTSDWRKQATLRRATGIFRILFRQVGEICARLQLLVDIVGLCLRGFDGLLDRPCRQGRESVS